MNENTGPGEFLGHYIGKASGATVGSSYGVVPALIAADIGSTIGRTVGQFMDSAVDAQSQKVHADYEKAILEGLSHIEASRYTIEVNCLND